MQRLAVALAVALSAGVLVVPIHAAGDAHVAAAETLVSRLDLADTDYAHGRGSVTWDGTVSSHTDCSGFIDHLLMHVDGYDGADFARWFGKARPTADRYHEAILEGHGFVPLRKVSELRPGDVIAIKYVTRHDNTGHIMLVVAAPEQMAASPPVVDRTTQWSIAVIDSSESGHGTTDTRHKRGDGGRDHDGLGRGVFRLYASVDGEVAGFSWSTMKASRFVAPGDEHVALGRFIPGFRP